MSELSYEELKAKVAELEKQDDQIIVVTPLYGFSSDSDELSIGELSSLSRYQHDSSLPFSPDDIFYKMLHLYKPDYLLWQHHRSSWVEHFLRPLFNPASCQSLEDLESNLLVLFWFPAINLFRLLRLFKPGRLVAGDSYVIFCQEPWRTVFWKRCSEMAIDYGLLHMQSGSYALSSLEVPFFKIFCESLLPLLKSRQVSEYVSPSPLEVALELYNEDEHRSDLAVLKALTAFEALLTDESSSELSYRLSLRVTNLLESDDASRIKTFRDMREFYDLRSKIVHGSASKLNAKLQARLQQVDSLRELLRKTILSVMALKLDGNSTKDRLGELLDEIVLDQAKRMEVQKLAAKFLHVGARAPYIVQ